MLAIPLMSAKCERIFSSAKHLVTDSRNRLKADIIEANECLKSWFGRPEAKAFAKGIDPDVDEQYEEEARDIDDNDLEENLDKDKDEGEGEGEGEGEDEDEDEDEDEEDPEGEAVKYTVFDD